VRDDQATAGHTTLAQFKAAPAFYFAPDAAA